MTVKLVQEMTQMARKLRQPKHTFQLRHRPWQIQPFLIAPVLPGETLKNIVMQSRVVVDPIKNPLVGWWIEYYFFYVKHRDLPGRADYTDMMVNMDKSMAAYNSATVAEYYENASGGLGWVGPCLQRITEEFFREKGEAWNNANIGNLPTAKVDQGENWMDSLTPDASVATRDLDTETGDVLTAETFDRQYKVWEFMRQNSMTNMSYEDYLRTYGVKIADRDEPYKPELLRVIREWQYPVNTVEPTTGVPSAAVSWAVRERIDKDRFFKEPGFIFAVSVARPKVYYTKQKGHASQMLVDAFSWLPALMATIRQRRSAKSQIMPARSRATSPLTIGSMCATCSSMEISLRISIWTRLRRTVLSSICRPRALYGSTLLRLMLTHCSKPRRPRTKSVRMAFVSFISSACKRITPSDQA